MQKNYFINQESSRYSVRKQDWFFAFCKNVSQKNCFCIWMKITTPRKTTRTFLYTQKEKKLLNVFIYKKQDTFQKARQFPLHFYIQKAIHFTLRDFSWNFCSLYLYTKSMTLCVTWRFNIQKARHFAKTKAICDTFLYTKTRHFVLRDFSLNFWKLLRGGTFTY